MQVFRLKAFVFVGMLLMAQSVFGASPVVTSTPITTGAKYTTYSYKLQGSDADGDRLTWSADATRPLPSWLTLIGGGDVTTLAGTGVPGSTDGPGVDAASFNKPAGIAVDSSGNVYVAGSYNNKIRKIDGNDNVTTLAGSGRSDSTDGQGSSASFNSPLGVAVDNSGNVYVADTWNHKIRKIDSSGNVTTLAGSGTASFADGQGTSASFYAPYGVAVDANNNVYVADWHNHKIRKIDSSGNVTTLAGSGTASFADGQGTSASFNAPSGVAVDANNNVYVAEYFNHRIRKIDSSGNVTTLAGSGTASFANGQGTSASFNSPFGVAVDANNNVYVSDYNNDIIRKIDSSGNVTTLAGIPIAGSTDGPGVGAASFNLPTGVAVDSSGNFYVADTRNHKIRKIDSSGNVTTFAGSGTEAFADGQGTSASFNSPFGVAVDSSGNFYVADTGNHKIRKIDSSGNVTTLAGSGTASFADGQGTSASFSSPRGVAVDANNNVYVADYYNHRIRKIDSSGNVTTFVGTGAVGSTDGLRNPYPTFNYPSGVAVDSRGYVYVADTGNHKIRQIDSSRIVSTLAGTGIPGYDNGLGYNNGRDTLASFQYPVGIAADSSGNVYVADSMNNKIRKIDSSRNVTTLAGTGTSGSRDGEGDTASFNLPSGVAVDRIGNVYVADKYNSKIRKIKQTTILSGSPGDTNGARETQDVSLILSDDNGNFAVHDFTITLSGYNIPTDIRGVIDSASIGDNETFKPFSELTLSDDDSTSFTATITLGYYDTMNGSLSSSSVSGTLSEIQEALRAITFTPFPNRVAVGSTESTYINLTVSANGTDSRDYTNVTVTNLGIVITTPDTININSGESTVTTATGEVDYVWEITDETQEDNALFNITADGQLTLKEPISVTTAKDYVVVVTAYEDGLSKTHTITVTVQPAVTLKYQGYLVKNNIGVEAEALNMTFKLYNSESNTTALWSSSKDVNVTRGIYNVTLGESEPLNKLDIINHDYYLGLTIGTNSEMKPRQLISPSGYTKILAEKIKALESKQ